MAQTTILQVAPSIGDADRIKHAVVQLTNTAAEVTFTLTPAIAGMSAFLAVIPVDESAAAATRVLPTRVAGYITSAALTFTAGDELTLLCIGV